MSAYKRKRNALTTKVYRVHLEPTKATGIFWVRHCSHLPGRSPIPRPGLTQLMGGTQIVNALGFLWVRKRLWCLRIQRTWTGTPQVCAHHGISTKFRLVYFPPLPYHPFMINFILKTLVALLLAPPWIHADEGPLPPFENPFAEISSLRSEADTATTLGIHLRSQNNPSVQTTPTMPAQNIHDHMDTRHPSMTTIPTKTQVKPTNHLPDNQRLPLGLALLALTPILKNKRLRYHKTSQRQATYTYDDTPQEQTGTLPQKSEKPTQARSYASETYIYDAIETSIWPNRDPIGEEGGVNLYAFVGNRATDHVDYLGMLITKFLCCTEEQKILVREWEEIVKNAMQEFGQITSASSAQYHDITDSLDRHLTPAQKDVMYVMWRDFVSKMNFLNHYIKTGMERGYRVRCTDLDGSYGSAPRTRFNRWVRRRTINLDNGLFENAHLLDSNRRPRGATTLYHELSHMFYFTRDIDYSFDHQPIHELADDAGTVELFINPPRAISIFVSVWSQDGYEIPSELP